MVVYPRRNAPRRSSVVSLKFWSDSDVTAAWVSCRTGWSRLATVATRDSSRLPQARRHACMLIMRLRHQRIGFLKAGIDYLPARTLISELIDTF